MLRKFIVSQKTDGPSALIATPTCPDIALSTSMLAKNVNDLSMKYHIAAQKIVNYLS